MGWKRREDKEIEQPERSDSAEDFLALLRSKGQKKRR